MKSTSVRDRILRAATRLFYQQGYRATGINAVIRQADAAKASLYASYASKEALAVVWLKTEQNRWQEGIQRILTQHKGAPVQALEAWFITTGQWVERHQYRGCPFRNTLAELHPGDTALRATVEEQLHWEREQLDGLVLAALSDGPKRPDRFVQSLTDNLHLLYHGAFVQAQASLSAAPFRAGGEMAGRWLDSLRRR